MLKRFCTVFLCGILLLAACVPCFAAQGSITVNGNAFSGTLAQAIALAGKGGTVGITGTVATEPVGYLDGTRVADVTIQGDAPGATITLPASFVDLNNSKYDVLTVSGANVILKNLTVDACLKVDFAIRFLNSSSHASVENVTARRGTRGAVNILSANSLTFKNVQANDSIQGGFYFDAIWDASRVVFENCTTAGNVRTGVLVRNGYGAVLNLNLAGITCAENTFAVEDRREGTIGGGERAEIQIVAAPYNAAGEVISTVTAKSFAVEQMYEHIRFGIAAGETDACRASITTDRYGFRTTVYYSTRSLADADVRTGVSSCSVCSRSVAMATLPEALGWMVSIAT